MGELRVSVAVYLRKQTPRDMIQFNIFIQNNAIYCMASTKNDKLKEIKEKKNDNIIYSSSLGCCIISNKIQQVLEFHNPY